MTLKLEIKGFDDIQKQLTRLAERDLRQVQEGVVKLLREDVALRFQQSPTVETGGQVHGNVEWRPLSEGYLNANPHRRGGQILIDTGQLRDSLTIENAPYSYVQYNPNSVEYGTTVPYATTQEKIGRQIVFLHPMLMQKISTFVTNYFVTGKDIPDGI